MVNKTLSDTDKTSVINEVFEKEKFINSLEDVLVAKGAHSSIYIDPKEPDIIIKKSNHKNDGGYLAQQKAGYDTIERIKKSGYAQGVQLPSLISITETDGVPTIKEQRITGIEFDRNDDLWNSISEEQRQDVARQMAIFLVAMHSTGEIMPADKSIKTIFEHSKIKNATDMINAFDGAMPQELADRLLNAEKYLEYSDISDEFHVLTHGDLRINNLMYDEKTNKLSVLDFEMARIGNVYRDFVAYASASSMPWDFTRRVIDEYNAIQHKKYPLKINPTKVQNMLMYAVMHEYSRCVKPEQNGTMTAEEKQKAFKKMILNLTRVTGFEFKSKYKQILEKSQNDIINRANTKQQNQALGLCEHE